MINALPVKQGMKNAFLENHIFTEYNLTMLFGPTAQTRRLRQPRPAAAEAADQNIQFSSKSERWGR